MHTFFLINLLIAATVAAQRNSGIHPSTPPTLTERSLLTGADGGARDDANSLRSALGPVVHVKRETNGDRFRRGQTTPLKPTKRKSALRPRASPAPACAAVTSTNGIIEVTRVSDGAVLGFIRNTFDGQNSYTFGVQANALTVSVPTSLQNNVATEFTAVNGPDAAHPFVGAVGGSGGYNFNTGNLGYAYLSGTGSTPANSPPSFTVGHSMQAFAYNGPAESTIWKIDCTTLAVTAQWTNDDGSQPATTIFYDPTVDFVGLMGDFSQFTATFPNEGAYLVTLAYVPVP